LGKQLFGGEVRDILVASVIVPIQQTRKGRRGGGKRWW
jgi:hypothetical protein